MQEPIIVNATFTLLDLRRAVRSMHRRNRASVLWTFLCGSALLYWGLKLIFEVPIAGGVLIMGSLYCFFATWTTSWFLAKKIFAGPAYRHPITFRFGEQFLATETQYSETETDWPGFVRWHEGKETLLLYFSKAAAQMVPKRFFASESDLDATRELLRRKLGDPS